MKVFATLFLILTTLTSFAIQVDTVAAGKAEESGNGLVWTIGAIIGVIIMIILRRVLLPTREK